MKIIQRIKQRFCTHIDPAEMRNYRMPFVGYSFRCSKCQGYVAYFTNWNEYMNISPRQHMVFVEEGEKIHTILNVNEERINGY